MVAPFGAEVAHSRMKMGCFTLHAEFPTPQNAPGALEMRVGPLKNAPKFARLSKIFFGIFGFFPRGVCPGGGEHHRDRKVAAGTTGRFAISLFLFSSAVSAPPALSAPLRLSRPVTTETFA